MNILDVFYVKGTETVEGDKSWDFTINGQVSGGCLNHEPTKKELELFQMGVIAERSRWFDLMADIVKDKDLLKKIDDKLVGDSPLYV